MSASFIRLGIIAALLLLTLGRAGAAPSVDDEIANGQLAQAAALLAQIPPNGPARGIACEKLLALLPLAPWSPQTRQAWSDCLTAIESQTDPSWGLKNMGDFLGALASPDVPRNAATAALLDRAAGDARRWPGQGAPLVVAEGLLWNGRFDQAFAVFPDGAAPAPLIEFALETLADKPQFGAQDTLWKLALARIGGSATARLKAVHALAFAGRLDQALSLAKRESDAADQVQDEIQAARYARYGGHESDFTRAMGVAASDLGLLSGRAAALPTLRDLMQETREPPVASLSDVFWKRVEGWAASLPADQSPGAVAEIAAASAWAGRDDAASLLPALSGSTWLDSARMRVACGWLWNGKTAQAAQCADAIKDPDWRALARTEMAYLARQRAAGVNIR